MSEAATQLAAAAERTGLSPTFVRTRKQNIKGYVTQGGMEAKKGPNDSIQPTPPTITLIY